ncbi:multifunctional 2',3'-cyclic-nucleotide 2'-phosphodiesterase/3'-nucleotidase/5'-nucleotidase [uncultured Clostridium sp.]|uniref:multifunctional 2',3'-cyclic-nucleotide 2'-phosphodiesterase/3'-nucleotidase/5'-nucleotidase n=1 Tax=uncultured Clostridium sp. TaxID=59620 RepID=UPI00259B54F7|nr:multifunctional 2',3'-cyclic-nucleotide 2'-phosphodiesterase/3'-nucleotidase/5'-nucleotidase [uncultured Clostridium sp.]
MLKKFSNKKITALMVVLAMVFSFILPIQVKAAEISETKNSNVTEKTDKKTVNIQILATSDLHGKFMDYDYAQGEESVGGLNQIATVVKEAKKENPNTLVLDNGDTIQGNYNHLFMNKENPMILAMNTIGYDVFSLGNHEFNFGMDKLHNIIGQANQNLHVLCGNLYRNGKRVFNPYTIKEVDGIKVAIIGVVTQHIMQWDSQNLKGYEAKNPTEEVKKIIGEIKANGGADVYVVTSHASLNGEYGDGDSAAGIAEANPEVSVVVAGHSHDTVKSELRGNAIISEPASRAKYVSKFNLTVEKNESGIKVLDKSADLISLKGVQGDPELTEKLKPFHEAAINDATAKIGELKGGDLAKPDEVKGIPQSIVEDQGVTDFINEVQLYNSKKFLQTKGIDPNNVYMVSSAALFSPKANLKEGPISKADVSNIYKFDNKLYVIKTNGKQLKKYMEDNSKFFNKYKDGDLTISFDENVRMYKYDMFEGVNYEINIAKDPGERIENLKFSKDGKPVEDSDVVYLSVNDYRYNSGLAAGIMDPGEHEKIYDTVNDDISAIRDLISDYIINVKQVINRNVDGNWKITGNNWNPEQRALAVKLINEGKIKLPTSSNGRTPNVKSVTWDEVSKFAEALPEEKKEVEIPILTFNDFHGSLKESGGNPGAAKFVGELKKVKEKNPNTIVVSGGDMYQGSALSNLLKGKPVSDINKALGVQFSSVGNHEFDWGYDLIPGWAKDGGFEFLASNIYEKATGEPVKWAKPYGVVEKGGKKIGFIGLATPETAYKTNPDNVKDLEFRDPNTEAEKWVKHLREVEKVDAVIALTHIGSQQDRKTGEITGEVVNLTKVPGLDAIVSAHSHMPVKGTVNGVPIVQAYKNGRAIGLIDLKFDKDGKLSVEVQRMDISKNIKDLPVDKEMEETLGKYEKELSPILDVKVADLSEDLPHNRDAGVSPMGATVTETMRKIVDADIAINNGGGVRAQLKKGVITVGDMYTILPFDNTIVTMDMKGSDIIKVLEHGIAPKDFGWGQHAGLKFWYNPDAEPGNRITSVRLLDGSKLDPNKYYKLATNDFMAAGGDGYDFSAAKNIKDTNKVLREGISDYWKNHGINPITNLATLIEPGEDKSEAIKPVEQEKPSIDTNKPMDPTIDNINTDKPEISNPDNNSNNEENKKDDLIKLPNTGNPFGAEVFAAMGVLATIGGSIILKKKHNDAA